MWHLCAICDVFGDMYAEYPLVGARFFIKISETCQAIKYGHHAFNSKIPLWNCNSITIIQQHLIIMRYFCRHCQRIDFVELTQAPQGQSRVGRTSNKGKHPHWKGLSDIFLSWCLANISGHKWTYSQPAQWSRNMPDISGRNPRHCQRFCPAGLNTHKMSEKENKNDHWYLPDINWEKCLTVAQNVRQPE